MSKSYLTLEELERHMCITNDQQYSIISTVLNHVEEGFNNGRDYWYNEGYNQGYDDCSIGLEEGNNV